MNRMPKNEITCIFFEIDMGMSRSNQFRCEIERPFTNLSDISTKLAGKIYIIVAIKMSETMTTFQFTLRSLLRF